MVEIKNLRKAAERILKAVNKQERIILYGDADLDGVTSVIILKDTIKNLGGKITAVYFPNREVEGYGISEQGLNLFKKEAPALFIAVDCGIGNFKEIKLAKELGFEIIIIDHHQVLDELPDADIIVDPKQKEDKYPFKGLAAVGIVFKLSEILLENKMTEILRKNFLELVAIATIADMMPREEENNFFIKEGLRSLEKSFRPGIKTFFETAIIKNYSDIWHKVSKINSILNIRDVENQLPASFRLLTAASIEETKELVEKLLIKAEIRKEKIKEITNEVEKRISGRDESIVFEGGDDFELTLISSVASIICQRYQKPTFLFKKLEQESQGTVRTPPEVDSVELMKKCSEYLLTYGGHSQASGFRIKNDKLDQFKNCLTNRVFAEQKRR